MALITYVRASGVTGGTVSQPDGSSFDVGAALTAGSGQFTVDSVANPQLVQALDASGIVVRSGLTPTAVLVPDRIGYLIGHVAGPGALGDIPVRGADGIFTPAQQIPVSGLPGAVPIGAPLDSGIRLYNPRGLRRWRPVYGDAMQAVAPIVIAGDSVAAGQGGDNNVTTFNNVPDNTQGFAGQIRSLFAAALGLNPGEGAIFTDESRVTTTYTNNNWSCVPLRHGPRALHGDGKTLQITIPAGVTRLTVVQANQTQAFNSAGSNLADVSALYSQTGSATVTNQPITTLTNTGRAIATDITCAAGDVITISSPATAQSYIQWLALKTGSNGVLVHRAGQPGYVSGDAIGGQTSGALTQAGSATNQTNAIRALYDGWGSTGLLILSFGVNDQQFQAGGGTTAQNGVTLALYTAWMQQIVNQAIADGWCVLLLGEPPNPNAANVPGGQESDYRNALKQIALATDHCAFLNIPDLWGSNANATALNLAVNNSVHPRRPGHGDIARLLFRVLTLLYGENSYNA